jgi:hypothetical protein
LYDFGFSFRLNEEGKLFLRPAERVTEEHRAYVHQHKAALVDGLTFTKSITISGRTFRYIPRWRGQVLTPSDNLLALDTETNLVDLSREIPQLALASVSASEQHSSIVHPTDLSRFLLVHRDVRFICHHSAFDFWAIEQHLRQRGEKEALALWWDIAASGRLHDSMLLDMLVRLARDDSYPDPRRLDEIGRDYAGLEITKDDPYRMRYGEIIGRDWDTVDPNFFDYAIKDAIVTKAAYGEIRRQAEQLLADFPGRAEILPDAVQRFGVLTENTQIRKSIALSQIQRNGWAVDSEWVRREEQSLRNRLDELTAVTAELCPGLYNVRPDGSWERTKTGGPKKNLEPLRQKLVEIATALNEDEDNDLTLYIPRTKKKGDISTKLTFWDQYADYDPTGFLKYWSEVEELAKLVQFFTKLAGNRAHSKYTTMVRTGRTSASAPNVQQIPKRFNFRRAFIAAPGTFLLTVDYAFIELIALASVCLRRYGYSELANTIRLGRDPHCQTAASILRVEFEEFMRWKNNPTKVNEKETLGDHFAKYRQRAKPVNFGVPGSFGVDSLQTYARLTYGVTLTREEAKEWRDRLINEVYPELATYLAEDAVVILARNLGVPVEEVRTAVGDTHLTCFRKVLAGDPRTKTGAPYKADYVPKVWAYLLAAAKNSKLLPEIQARRAEGDTAPEGETKEQAKDRKKRWEALSRRVCQAGVVSLTGRLRGRVRYSQSRNSPFQSLAADGAGEALFRLVREGYRVTAFIHDETLAEVADEGGFVSENVVRRFEQIKREAMAGVLGCDIPVSVESALSVCWSKQAKLLVEDGKVYPWKPLDDFHDELRREGFAPRIEDDKLWLNPGKVLTTHQRLLLKVHERALIEKLKTGPDDPSSPPPPPAPPPPPPPADAAPAAGEPADGPGVVEHRPDDRPDVAGDAVAEDGDQADVPAVVVAKSEIVTTNVLDPTTKAVSKTKAKAYTFPGSALKWFGGKAGNQGKLAKWIVAHMCPHLIYAEAYFGGGTVLLARDPEDRRLWTGPKDREGVCEYVNDIDQSLTTFFRVLASADADELIDRLKHVPFSQIEWEQAGTTWQLIPTPTRWISPPGCTSSIGNRRTATWKRSPAASP